ncbi:XRE family transcriptional regulator [Lentzea sp. NBC_00516]|uniref:XRE family transcriptional regulator n=1 Tax=Lentzea sp. NBC_00516 TaxID=2903582 RepID=UPI002E808051|nr:XRE family transcriptional regulator [Lentzea sp. NBC_00516]WUD26237.1 XRE family transcriptional regulator [Lentzea sp. NBC_00516]
MDEFAQALRTAITNRGLGLERLREHLSQNGVSVSMATLSYWQTGRSRPERQKSLQAVVHLEHILQLPPGHLSELLGPPRPRGRWLRHAPAPMSAFWPSPSPVEQALHDLDTQWDDQLLRVSQQDFVTVGADRTERAFRSRQVLSASMTGPDRWVVIMHVDSHDRPLPLVNALKNCTVGQVVREPSEGLLVAELLFERPLRKGESVVIEHELVNQDPCPLATNYERKFRLPTREYVLEVTFEGAAPASVVQLADGSAVTPGRTLLDVALDVQPGVRGFSWTW